MFQPGEWHYEVMNLHTSPCQSRIRVEGFPDLSHPADENRPILLTSRTNKVNVDVDPGTSAHHDICFMILWFYISLPNKNPNKTFTFNLEFMVWSNDIFVTCLTTDAESPLDNIVTLYATLKQGLSPVLEATVYAVVEMNNVQQTVQLHDNSIGKSWKLYRESCILMTILKSN